MDEDELYDIAEEEDSEDEIIYRTYRMDFKNKRIIGMVDGIEASAQAMFKALQTRRGMDFFSVRNGEITEKGRKGQGWHLYPVKIEGYAAYVAAHKKGDKSNEL